MNAPFPIYAYHKQHADDAFAVHAALLRAEQRNPALSENPAWTILKQDAYERFALAFGAIS